MPPTAKKYKIKEVADASDKSAIKSPEKTVVSGQLEKSLANKRKARQGKYRTQRGVVFVKNLPHGFFEDQLQKYFQQFGKVTRVRLARSARSGGSKGFAFVEFSVPEVAEIAAETMNNYLMFRKLVKAAYIPPNEQKFNYFRTSVRRIQNKVGKPVYVSYKTRAINRKMNEVNSWSEENYDKRMKKTEHRIDSMKQKFADIDFDVDSCVLKPENGDVKSPASEKSNSSQNSSKDKVTSEKSPSTGSEVSASQQKGRKRKAETVTVERLMDATIEEDSSSDEDFIPDDKFDPSEEETESAEDDEDVGANKAQKGKTIPLKRLLEDTIEDDSDDDDFDPESGDDDDSASADDDDDSPQKSVKKALNKLLSQNKEQSKLEKMIQRKPHEGGIQKKTKAKKPQAKSRALREKIQDSVKEMAKQKQVGRMKPNGQKKAGKGRA